MRFRHQSSSILTLLLACWGIAAAACPKGNSIGRLCAGWVWTLRLQLADATAQLEALLFNEDGTAFFRVRAASWQPCMMLQMAASGLNTASAAYALLPYCTLQWPCAAAACVAALAGERWTGCLPAVRAPHRLLCRLRTQSDTCWLQGMPALDLQEHPGLAERLTGTLNRLKSYGSVK